MLDLTQYYKEATDEDLKEFAKNEIINVDDVTNLVKMSDSWVRRKISLVMQSGILEEMNIEETKGTALLFGIELNTVNVDGRPTLVLPETKVELKKLLRFLDEDYFQSVLRSKPHLSNSKRQISAS